MAQPKKPLPELGVTELLSAEITHLLMRADRVQPGEVEALVTRVRTSPMRPSSGQPKKPETST